MDLDVPGEILAQMASFLSKRDCNSIIRTSKTAYNKLSSYRKLLPKAQLNAIIQYKNGNFLLHVNTERKNMVIEISKQQDDLMTTNEDDYANLLAFYKENTVNSETMQLELRSVVDSLPLHLKLLFEYFHVKRLILTDLNDKCYELITTKMRENSWKVDILRLEAEFLPSSTLELISACNPKGLIIDSDDGLPVAFFRTPVIKDLPYLHLYNNNFMGDRDLLSLKAAELVVLRAYVTIQGFISFLSIFPEVNCQHVNYTNIIQEWIEAKRKVRLISITVRTLLSAVEWRANFDGLNQDLVEIEITPGRLDELSAKLRRRSDGCLLIFWWNEHNDNSIRMEVE